MENLGKRILQDHPGLASRLLSHWISGGTKLGGVRRILFESLVGELDSRYYRNSCTSEERERLKALCMGKDSAVQWAKQYLKRGFPEAQTAFLPIFTRLEELLLSNSMTVHQVGCCSGREVAYYAKKYPHSRFVGSDCDEDLILFLRETWQDLPNLSFELLRLENKADIISQKPCDLLVASGGFHYLDAAVLQLFFSSARRFSGKILLSQPLDGHYNAGNILKSTPRKQMSWNHPYPAYLRSTGWKDVEWIETFLEGNILVKNIAAFASS